jgi:hypothetical protein
MTSSAQKAVQRQNQPVAFRNADLEPMLQARVNPTAASPGLVAVRDLERYYKMMAAALKRIDLSRDEAALLADLFNGTIWTAETANLLYAQVEDSIPDGYPEKWSVDAAALVAKLRKLNGFQCLAIVDALERFWAITDDLNVDERLTAVGLIKGELNP